MKNKQTAVEWLLEQIDDIYIHQVYNKEFNQAKELEKRHIKEMYLKGIENYHLTIKNK